MAADRNFWTGVLVLGAAAFAAAVLVLSGANRLQPTATRYFVAADDLAGVTEGTPVEMGGFELGTVERVRVLPEPRLHFTLTITVRRDVPVPEGTSALIASRSVAGGTVLRLVPPAEQAPPLPAGATLVATREANLSDVLATANRTLDNLEAVTREFRAVLVDGSPGANAEGLGPSVARLNRALDDARTTLASAGDLMRSLESTSRRAGPALERDLRQLESTIGTADRVVGNVERLVQPEGEVPRLLAEVAGTLDELDRAARAVQAYDPQRNEGMARTLKQLEDATASLDRFMREFEKKPLRTLSNGVQEPPPAEAEPPAR